MRDITVRFGGLVANDAASLDAPAGEVSAIIGPNGAGKTTLFNVITGAQRPTSGRIVFDGEDITDLTPRQRAHLGMARTFQNLALVPTLSVLENASIGLGRFRRTGVLGALVRSPRTRCEDALVDQVAWGALELTGLTDDAHLRADQLSYGDRRRVEFARALAMQPSLLLLDEPSAGMAAEETAEFVASLRRATEVLDLTVLVVEHDMTFVRAIATHTAVLDFGHIVAAGPTAEVLADQRVIDAYLGSQA
ncbi:MAG: ABC transporter ATP-binding protein [Acidimicrobiales bacterium]|nr:ABC transporter ATP-binding protein [Acidimicrobiales bacterium]